MLHYESFLIVFLFIIVLNFLFNKFNLIRDKKNISFHKKFTGNEINPPFSGGIFIIATICIFFPENFIIKLFLLLIFFIGYCSDTNLLKSPNLRFYLQIIVVILLIIFSDIFIQSIRIDFFDSFLENFIFKLFFTTFCILILINGTNFLDGVNTLVIGYYLLIFFFISKIHYDLISYIDLNFLYLLIFTLLILFVLNCFNLLLLGDNGSYLISIFAGIYLIDLANKNILLSPYFIMNLLWYPAYETLFSIIRKIMIKKSALSPDNFHLHQLFYLAIKKKVNSKIYSNSLTGIIINIYNLIIFYLASTNYSNTKYQLALAFLSILIYNILYILLKTNLKNLK